VLNLVRSAEVPLSDARHTRILLYVIHLNCLTSIPELYELVSELILNVVRLEDLIRDEEEIMILWESNGFRCHEKDPH
jgi:hypothetical protein